jgi:CheY-like chemotaxis protein
METARYTILVVDDQEDNIEIVQRKLSHSTYRCIGEQNSERVIAVALRERPDLIIMDWQMPVMNGMDVLNKMKSDEKLSAIPVIIMTGIRNDPESVRIAMSAGASFFLDKPIDTGELNSCVTSILEHGAV